MKRFITSLALAAATVAPAASAQQAGADTLIVMTVPLRHLSGKDAVALLRPYASTLPYAGGPGGDVSAPPGGQAVTIREKAINYARMLRVLQDYDKAPPEVNFTFQLIIADKSGVRATEIASLDSVLRGALKYTGYKLVSTAVLRSSESSSTGNKLTVEGQSIELGMRIDELRGGPEASARLMVGLERLPATGRTLRETLLHTSVTIPIGQTVVLGSAAFDKDRAIILTVRPQLVAGESRGKED